ncbi:MAG: Trx7/PDZ domain-containing (seleno)protein [Planctomycetaceae bacterium]
MSRNSLLFYAFAFLIAAAFSAEGRAQTREEKVREDRRRVEADGFWIYNDLPKAFAEAERTGKPIVVGLRCIPCEECVKLDDELVDTDPAIRPLLEQFVCVRVVATNGLDLSLFQYDTDQSFAMFMLNADRTIYGRFGTRSHRTEWLGDVSLKGLAVALEKALELHRNYPTNKQALAGKTGQPLEFASPELFPSLKDKFTDSLNYEGEVVKSCIHCHQIGDARRDFYRQKGQPIPEKLLYSYPHPKVVGLTMDPQKAATVKAVEPGSAADDAGIKAGDEITSLAGQPLISVADVQWVLHNTDPSGGQIAASILRESESIDVVLNLEDGWRRADDISWRVSSWGLRRMSTGGLKLAELPANERRQLKIADDHMALKVEHVGQYGAHAAAKNAGFEKGDVIVQFDGHRDLLRDGDVLAYGVTQRKPGDKVPVTVLRNGSEKTLQLPMQE